MKQLTVIALALGLALPAEAQQATDAVQPEGATASGELVTTDAGRAALAAKQAGKPAAAQDWMVTAAHPLAVEAGAEILRQGGSAADAMVTVQTVLGLVEPQSSGLGGGSLVVWYDAATGAVTTLDARETAPLAATPVLFQDDAGQPLKFFDAVVGGRSVGTPGTPAVLEEAHRRWGKANWQGLFQPAIDLASNGFEVSPRLADLVASSEYLSRYPATAAYFLPGGQPIAAGSTLTNAAYAETLQALAERGASAFYTGEIAEGIVGAVRGAEDNPGLLSTLDLALYRVKERPAVCVAYRERDVCGMGPPSSGGLTIGQILGMLQGYDLAGMGPDSADVWRLIGDASRLAFADRERFMADSDFVPMPTAGLTDAAYLAERGKLLAGDDALPEVAPGNPAFDHASNWADDISIEFPSTSHISIVDSYGNALAMTTTIEGGFGSHVMAPGGFLLNNELTDFSFATHTDGVPIANRVEPGKRPRSSMAPTIILRDGKPELVIGSPGGSRIIGYVAQAIIAHIDWGMDVQQAVAMPHFVNRFGTFDLEEGTTAADLAPALQEMGFETKAMELNSGLHAIAIGADGLTGGADPRREGIAIGE